MSKFEIGDEVQLLRPRHGIGKVEGHLGRYGGFRRLSPLGGFGRPPAVRSSSPGFGRTARLATEPDLLELVLGDDERL